MPTPMTPFSCLMAFWFRVMSVALYGCFGLRALFFFFGGGGAGQGAQPFAPKMNPSPPLPGTITLCWQQQIQLEASAMFCSTVQILCKQT